MLVLSLFVRRGETRPAPVGEGPGNRPAPAGVGGGGGKLSRSGGRLYPDVGFGLSGIGGASCLMRLPCGVPGAWELACCCDIVAVFGVVGAG